VRVKGCRTRTHGLRSTYVNGCRCDACREANTIYGRGRYRSTSTPTCVHCHIPIVGISVGWKHVSDNRQFGDDGHEAAPKVIA
jgi:hypothetical protein